MTVAPTSGPRTGAATRRRGDNLRKAIFDAVFEQMQAVGYANLTMDKVAAAARTSKTVLYRRWATKDDMIDEALRDALPTPAAVALSGDVRTDVHALLRCVQDSFTSTRGTAFQLVSAQAGCERGFVRQAVIQYVVEPCIELIFEVLRRGAERGEVRPEAASRLVASSGPAMLVQYSLLHGTVLPDEFVASVVDQIVLPLVAQAPAGGDRPTSTPPAPVTAA
ncbi:MULTISPECIES: TetR/AcrR family transcriptional regulator [unclassified Pseudofrankia]|uniref:TetR/AcrR family transcriptional regulator n=1 Tax=unclassified Pseudofrankia TaxID=2994372 RepID=UPI0008D905E6|nr:MULTISPECIES: TetR/AcrR family transcriptional regulator [unclassified Pseudofrankia]MDT3445681.1 TetR/AcrR family transcriptional regulator [Pseudofrankia sp. BMG5.37]OHV42502.1 TetR family transcriptional regulator [Pseudofrankia sp. BMG5.36]